jgi:hypothetical protein
MPAVSESHIHKRVRPQVEGLVLAVPATRTRARITKDSRRSVEAANAAAEGVRARVRGVAAAIAHLWTQTALCLEQRHITIESNRHRVLDTDPAAAHSEPGAYNRMDVDIGTWARMVPCRHRPEAQPYSHSPPSGYAMYRPCWEIHNGFQTVTCQRRR